MDPAACGTHTLRRTKASLIFRRTKNLRAVRLLLGHTKVESTVRYLGIEADGALEMAEQTEVQFACSTDCLVTARSRSGQFQSLASPLRRRKPAASYAPHS